MKLFLDTANLAQIREGARWGVVDGVTTNPTLVAKEQRPFHETIREIWNNDLSMAHLSPLGYPLLKFIIEYYGFRILRLEKDRAKPKMIWLLPFVWIIRASGRLASKKRREAYRLDDTTKDEIILGGNTLIIVGEKT